MNTDAELIALLYQEKTTPDIIVAIPGYFASFCDVTSEVVCLMLRLTIAGPYYSSQSKQNLFCHHLTEFMRQFMTEYSNRYGHSISPTVSKRSSDSESIDEVMKNVTNDDHVSDGW